MWTRTRVHPAPKLNVDGAGAWLLPWAKQQLARFKRLTSFGSRQFDLPTGEKVRIQWGILDKIRITSGSATGRKHEDGAPERFFDLDKGSLVHFGETPGGANSMYNAVMSLDGDTTAGHDGSSITQPTTVYAMRKRKAQASASLDTQHGIPITPFEPNPGVVNNRVDIPSDIHENIRLGSNTFVGLSQDGTLLCVRETRAGLPRVFSISTDADNTHLTLLSSGVPTWINDFYTSLSWPHELYRDTSSHDAYAAGELYALAVVADGTFHRMAPPAMTNDSLTSNAAIDRGQVIVQLGFDAFSDRPVMLAIMPYVSNVVVDTDTSHSTTATTGYRVEMRTYDRDTNEWVAVYAEQYDHIMDFDLDSTTGGNLPHFLAGGNNAIKLRLASGIGVRGGPDFDLIAHYPRIVAAADGVLAIGGVYTRSTPAPVRLNGVEIGTANCYTSMIAAGSQSVIVEGLFWVGPWGSTPLTSSLQLTPSGSEGIANYQGSGAGLEYWLTGALSKSYEVPPTSDTATEADYNLYNTAPTRGFHFIKNTSFVGWSYTDANPARFKIDVFVRVRRAGSGTVDDPYTYSWQRDTVDLGWDTGLSDLRVQKTYSAQTQRVSAPSGMTPSPSFSYSDANLTQTKFLVQ